MKRAIVTGSSGFMGKNLVESLKRKKDLQVQQFHAGDNFKALAAALESADYVFHLAGVNRPKDKKDFFYGNSNYTKSIVDVLQKHKRNIPFILSSSVQAVKNNPYGMSKRKAEEAVINYARETGAQVFIYRLPNVFGKWSRPNYNSVVATFCHNIANNLPIEIHDPSASLTLAYIDDVIRSFEEILSDQLIDDKGFVAVDPTYTITLKALADMLNGFKADRERITVPDMSDPLVKKLYATYLSFLPADKFSYPLKMNVDERGSFTEFMKTPDRGQVSVNISKPSITKGDHWHDTKNEKFLVVAGQGVIRFRKIGNDDIFEYHVSGAKLEVIEIPPGYTHNIENTGEVDMITVMWANEPFDPHQPDTFFEKVAPGQD